MPLFQSVLKQYTAPTCILEILSRSSATEAPSHALSTDPESFQLKIHPPLSVENAKGTEFLQSETDEPTILTIVLRGTVEQLRSLHTAVQNYLQGFLAKSNVVPNSASTNNRPIFFPVDPPPRLPISSGNTGIQLQRRSLTQHTLQLGSLTANPSVSAIELASTQLFDLVGTLDRFAQDVPSHVQEPQRLSMIQSGRVGRQGVWIAATALAALGLAGLTKVLPSWQGPFWQVASQSATENQPALSNTGNQSSPGVLPGLPTGSPLPTSQGVASRTPAPTPTPTVVANGLPLAPATPYPAATLSVPAVPVPVSTSLPTPLPNPVTIVPPTATQSSSTAARLVPKPVTRPSPPVVVPPTFAIASRSPQLDKARGSNTAAQPYPLGDTPLKPIAQSSRPPQTGVIPQVRPEARTRSLETLSPIPPDQPAAESDKGGGTALDTIQQVREVRQYFQGRWTPPSGLSQVLEYQLSVNSDGSLWKIAPLGEAASRYFDSTGIPSPGVPFVSPIPNRQRATVRLVLSPDGTVQTFFEGLSQ